MARADTLAVAPSGQHSTNSCGQSRGRGLVTSDSERRSNAFGRVAVTHVQGSPKGGGALGSLEVTSTRLASVPPYRMEAGMREFGLPSRNDKDSSGELPA